MADGVIGALSLADHLALLAPSGALVDRGAAIVAGGEESLEIAEYTATQIKQAVAGTGGANKEQVMMMVMHLLKLTTKPQIDASDALAIALCHAHTRSSLLPHGLGAARSRGGRLRL